MLPWLPFGPGDHDARPPGGPLKHYTQCMFGTKENTYGKTIANMHWVSAGSSAHSFWYRCAQRGHPAFLVVCSLQPLEKSIVCVAAGMAASARVQCTIPD